VFNLRDYQSEALAAVEASWGEGINRPVVVLPTGAGKTVCFSGLIQSMIKDLRAKGERVLVLAHREELLEQAEAKIKSMVPGIWTCVLKGARGQNKHQFADVIVASVQTLARPRRREAVDRIGLVIVDECHRYAAKSYKAVLEHYGCLDERATRTVGFTATLTRMDGGLPEVWQSVAYQKKIHWMIKSEYLVPPVARSIEVPGLNLSKTRVTGGDLNTGDLSQALEDSAAFKVIAESWNEHASERPTITFMPDVRTAEAMRDAFQAVGTTAEIITGNTPSGERKAVYSRFEDGTTQILVNCMVLTEGFDAPKTSCVIIGRPTLNPGLYIQMVGRGLRLHPESGKTNCLVLDIAGASLKHNLAGVNDLESDCEGRCDCNCLTCGCSDRCKCGIRQCGCRCLEQHDTGAKICKCAAGDECGCGCPGDMDGTGLDACVCPSGRDCGCFGEGPVVEDKEVSVDELKNLVDVDILGTELARSSYSWLKTLGGISFLTIGQERHLFLLPATPNGQSFYMGLVEGPARKATVKRLDSGATDAATARQMLEDLADSSGYSYNNRKASWRRTPASQAQLGLLVNMGHRTEDVAGLKKGEASDLLSVTKVSRMLDPRFGKYVTKPS
jgi:superfamily II DNA or RNA helicase